jgi:hypothetical protein
MPRLLLDQNLAPALARRLADLYPDSAHVRDLGLAAADDEAVWEHAAARGFTIVTKDDDFRQRSVLGDLAPARELPDGGRRSGAAGAARGRPRGQRRRGGGAPHPRAPRMTRGGTRRRPRDSGGAHGKSSSERGHGRSRAPASCSVRCRCAHTPARRGLTAPGRSSTPPCTAPPAPPPPSCRGPRARSRPRCSPAGRTSSRRTRRARRSTPR